MGLLTRFLGGKKKQKRNSTRQRRSPDELNALRRHNFMNGLRARDPELYNQIMLDDIMGTRRRKEKEVDPIEQVVSTLHTLRAEGLIDDPRSAAEDKWWKDALSSLAPGIGVALARTLMPALAGGAPVAQQQPMTVAEPPYQEPPRLDGPHAQHIGSPPTEEPPVTFYSRMITMQLEPKTPEEAAEWLVQQPLAQEFVAMIMHTPDDHIPATLAEMSNQGPDYAATVWWLRGRPEWFMAVVRAVRALKEDQPQPEKGKSSRMGI